MRGQFWQVRLPEQVRVLWVLWVLWALRMFRMRGQSRAINIHPAGDNTRILMRVLFPYLFSISAASVGGPPQLLFHIPHDQIAAGGFRRSSRRKISGCPGAFRG